MRSFVRHSVNQDTERYNAWLVRLRHSCKRSDTNHRHRINNLKKISHAAAGYEPTAVTWHQRRLICSPQLCPSRNSALPYRVSASYGGRQPPHSAVQPVQVMTTRRRFSQVTETLARRHPKASLSACSFPGDIGAGQPSSEQTSLPKASVHAVRIFSHHCPGNAVNQAALPLAPGVCAFPATRLSQPVSLWSLVTRRRCSQTSKGTPAFYNICSPFSGRFGRFRLIRKNETVNREFIFS